MKRFIACAALFLCLLWAFATGRAGVAMAEAGQAEPSAQAQASPAQVGVTESTNANQIIRYEEIARNEHLVFYGDTKTGHFAIQTLSGGDIWYSTPNDTALDPKTKGQQKMALMSQLVVSYLYNDDVNTDRFVQTVNSQAGCVNKESITVEVLENGFRVHYNFVDMGFVIPVEYTIEGENLIASIDVANMDEGDMCVVIAIHLLPTMGAGNWEEDGYLLVPDGSGAIAPFNTNITLQSLYDTMVYGDDATLSPTARVFRKEAIRLPVFGIAKESKALFGVITEGDGASSLFIYNGNSSIGYNAIAAKAHLRLTHRVNSFYATNKKTEITQLATAPHGMEKFTVKYFFLEGEQANYTGMADAYRQHLIDGGQLTRRAQKPSLSLDLYGLADIRTNTLGITHEKNVPLTTFSQALDIVEALGAKGIDSTSVRFIGWTDEGIDNTKYPQSASPSKALGGQAQFDALSAALAEKGAALYPEMNPIHFANGGNGVGAQRDSAKTPYGNPALIHEYYLSIYETKLNEAPRRLLKPARLAEMAGKFADAYMALGQPRISLGVAGSTVYSSFAESDAAFRSYMPGMYRQILEKYEAEDISLAVEGGNAYAIPYVEKVYDAPIYSSGHDIFFADVPFYQMVFHGYVTMTVPEIVQSIDPEVTFLKAVETGSELLYAGIHADAAVLQDSRYQHLYSATYTLWAEGAAARYQAYQPLLETIYDQPITAHESPAPGVAATTYANGVKVYVNYNEAAVTVDGVTVDGMGFASRGGAK